MSLELVLITGMSGSGKSVALHALEDAGYNCVYNLPPELLLPFIQLSVQQQERRQAVAIDVRSAQSLPMLPSILQHAQGMKVHVRLLFLDASTPVLVQRFSETRRRHPLSVQDSGVAGVASDLMQAIERERDMLAQMRDNSHIIDTSVLRANQLQTYVKSLVDAPSAQLTLMFESFAFKRGIPVHADFVFDARMLPNPHYEPELKALTGMDAPVAGWLARHAEVQQMVSDIEAFLRRWLPRLAQDHRSYVTVAIGCTGGQHRSVYLVERLAAAFDSEWVTLKRHREQSPASHAPALAHQDAAGRRV
ncbi:MAG: RNase adapter RapZ [Alphaproteobacteria bacterium]|nr:RNase adapter RapZ [Alphaproteobacteria bacterium]